MGKGISKKESAIAELLRIAQVLKSNGVNLKNIQMTKYRNRKQIPIKLSEIKQEGIDIDKIIKENRFKSRFSLWV